MMTKDQALEDIGNIDQFCHQVCNACTSNDWYCPTECDVLVKARGIGFNRILKCYARHDGDLRRVIRYIKSTKVDKQKGGY